jgi:hypothetical protein
MHRGWFVVVVVDNGAFSSVEGEFEGGAGGGGEGDGEEGAGREHGGGVGRAGRSVGLLEVGSGDGVGGYRKYKGRVSRSVMTRWSTCMHWKVQKERLFRRSVTTRLCAYIE